MSSTEAEPVETATTQTEQDSSIAQATQKGDSFPRVSTLATVLLVGIYFGIVLTKSEVVRWQRVHDMFLLREPFMYLIIGTGIVVAGLSMLLMKKVRAKSIHGELIVYDPKPFHVGVRRRTGDWMKVSTLRTHRLSKRICRPTKQHESCHSGTASVSHRRLQNFEDLKSILAASQAT